jgi:hypothetical protein
VPPSRKERKIRRKIRDQKTKRKENITTIIKKAISRQITIQKKIALPPRNPRKKPKSPNQKIREKRR